MKKSIVTLFVLHVYCIGTAQLLGGAMVVNDPKANAALMKQITQSVKTVEQTTKTVRLLKETKEMYDDINSALQTLNYITDMSNTTKMILQNSGSFLQEIQASNMFTTQEMNRVSQEFSGYMGKGNTILKVANDLMKGGIFKMNDAERLSLLKQSEQELNEALADTRIARNKYLRIAEKRAMVRYFSQTQKQ